MSKPNIMGSIYRPEIVSLIPPGSSKILDVGCGAGDVGHSAKRIMPCEVTGIEIDSVKAKTAASKIDRVINADAETFDSELPSGYFDCVIFADVLEHLKDPLAALAKYLKYLREGGVFVISVPNVRHFKVLFDLILLGDWKYEPFGLLDEGHIRFFTLKSFRRLMKKAGVRPVSVKRIFSIKGSKYLNVMTFGIFRNFFTAQYVFCARKNSGGVV